MPSKIVDLSARSHIIRDEPFHLHFWELTPNEALAFLKDPRGELQKLGINLPDDCRIETTIENHDWISTHTASLAADNGTIICNIGGGDVAKNYYKVSMYGHDHAAIGHFQKELIHEPTEHERKSPPLTNEQRINRTALRQSLRASPLHLQVHSYLAPLTVERKLPRSEQEAHDDFVKITDMVGRLVQSDPMYRDALETVAAWVAQPIKPEYLRLYQYERRPDSNVLKTYLSSIYACALVRQQWSRLSSEEFVTANEKLLQNAAPTLARLKEGLQKIDHDFIGHLICEAELRATEDAYFARVLNHAWERFTQLRPQGVAEDILDSSPDADLDQLAGPSLEKWWSIPAHIVLATMLWQQ